MGGEERGRVGEEREERGVITISNNVRTCIKDRTATLH